MRNLRSMAIKKMNDFYRTVYYDIFYDILPVQRINLQTLLLAEHYTYPYLTGIILGKIPHKAPYELIVYGHAHCMLYFYTYINFQYITHV